MTIELTGVNDAPEPEELIFEVSQNDEGLEFDLLDGVFDAEDDLLTTDSFFQVAGRDVFPSFDFGIYKFLGDAADDISGIPQIVGDVTGDGIVDYAVRIENTPAGGRFLLLSGEESVLQALDANDGSVDGQILLNASAEAFGTVVEGNVGTRAGDINNDGVDDLIFSDGNAGTGGEIYIAFGGSTLASFGADITRAEIDGTNGFTIGGVGGGAGNNGSTDALSYFFSQAIGDVTGDGVGDFIAGAQLADADGIVDAGEAYIISGADLPLAADANGFVDADSLLAFSSYRIDGGFGGIGTEGQLGNAVGGGDIDGDGIADLLVSAPRAGGVNNAFETGEAYILFGGVNSLERADSRDDIDDNTINVVDLTPTVGYRLLGGDALDRAGISVQVIGDVSGDGIDDFIVGADEVVSSTNTGEAYLVFGGRANLAAFDAADGTTDGNIRLEGVAAGGFGYLIEGENPAELFGNHVTRAGDIDGDGVDDFLIGNIGQDVFNSLGTGVDPQGAARLLYGGQLSTLDAADGVEDAILNVGSLTRATGLVFTEEAQADLFGHRSAIGDFDGDGRIDIAISAAFADEGADANVGATYIFRGGSEGFDQLDQLDGLINGRIDTSALIGRLIEFNEGSQGAFRLGEGDSASFDPNSFTSLGVGQSEDIVIEYDISDGIDTVTNTVTITVNGENDAPIGDDAALLTDEDTFLSDNLFDAAGIVDPDANGTITVSAVNGATLAGGVAELLFDSGASATILEDGSVDFDPLGFYDDLQAGQSIDETFTFTVTDDQGAEITRTATITIDGVNDAPVAPDLNVSVGEDAQFNGDLASDATDPDSAAIFLSAIEGTSLPGFGGGGDGQGPGLGSIGGNAVAVANDTITVTLASGATVTASSSGAFTYDPGLAFQFLSEGDTAPDSFTYTLTDSDGGSATFTANFTVTGANDGAAFGGTAPSAVSLVSITADGTASGNLNSLAPQIAQDGSELVFTSIANNLVTPDANETLGDIFLADLDAGGLEQVNLIDGTSNQGTDATNPTIGAVDGAIGGDFVVFHTGADDLNALDDNNQIDVYVRNRSTGETELISVNFAGDNGGNQGSLNASISADGRFVAFQSTASDLVETDANDTTADVFLHDRVTGETITISNPGGDNIFSAFNPRISSDGSTVVFATRGVLAGGDDNARTDIYAYDVAAGTYELISKDSAGVVGNDSSQDVSVSANGRYVYFASRATNLVGDDANGLQDGFVHDRVTGVTERVSVSTSGVEADAQVEFGVNAGQISDDGRFVTFTTTATNLDEITPDTNGVDDVYLHDRITGETVRVSISPDLLNQPGGLQPTISADGSRIAFVSNDSPGVFDPRAEGDGALDVYVADVAIRGGAFETNDGVVQVQLLNGFVDPEGDDLDVSGVVVTTDKGTNVAFTVDAETGVLTIDTAQFEGNAPGDYELLTVSYSVDSADGISTAATAGVSVLRSAVPLLATDDSFSIDEDTVLSDSVALNDIPPIGADFTLLDGPSLGDLTFNADGTFTYDPTEAFNFLSQGDSQTVFFTYLIEFGGETDLGDVAIEIAGVNDGAVFGGTVTQNTTLVTLNTDGTASGDGESFTPHLSQDGATILFISGAPDLTDPDSNGGTNDAFLADLDAGTIEKVNLIDGTSDESDGGSGFIRVSDDLAGGRFSVFASDATDLNAADGNAFRDVFVRDLVTGATEIISLNANDLPSNGTSLSASISEDGRFVAFASSASDLVESDPNGLLSDVFLHDREAGFTVRISNPDEGTGVVSITPRISADGSTVVFATNGSYDAADTNGLADIYAYDTAAGTLELISTSSGGVVGNADSQKVSVSANGRYVYFLSDATNLVGGDTNNARDAFVHDRVTGVTERVSVSTSGVEAEFDVDNNAFENSISADGRFVAFATGSSNLDEVNPDTNGDSDVFVRDRLTGETIRISAGGDPFQQPLGYNGSLSAQGERIAWSSYDDPDTLNPLDNNANGDIYYADLNINGGAFETDDGVVQVDLLAKYLDPEGDDLDVSGVTVTSDNGTNVAFTVDEETGVLTIDLAQFEGNAEGAFELLTINYAVDSADGVSVAATAGVSVERSVIQVDAVDDSFTTDEDTVLSDSVATNDIPDEGAVFTLISGVPDGDLTLNSDGTFTFDPTLAFNDLADGDTATVSFIYEISFNGETAQATASIDIDGVNDGPAFVVTGPLGVTLVSDALGGITSTNADASGVDIAGDGDLIAFHTEASNLLGTDANILSDIYLDDGVDPFEIASRIDGGNGAPLPGNATDGALNASVSDGGRFVAFQSDSSDLTAVDTGGQTNIYVRDTLTQETRLVSLNFDGELADGDSFNPSISGDGRFVAFETTATDLVQFSGDGNGAGRDVVVFDLVTGNRFHLTQNSDAPSAGESFAPTISADGTTVVFLSEEDFDDEDDNGLIDVYAVNIAEGGRTYVSQAFDSTASDGDATLGTGDVNLTSTPTISDNGQYVAFTSQATNLVGASADTNGFADVFVHNIVTGDTELVSVNAFLEQGNGDSFGAAISGDGRFVAFETLATNIDAFTQDTNGLSDIHLYDRLDRTTVRVTLANDNSEPGGGQAAISDDGSKVVFVSDATGGYDPRVTSSGIENVYLAEFDTTGVTRTDNDGTLFIDLTRDLFDPEGDVIEVDNIDILTDNPDRFGIVFDQPIDGDGQLLPGVEIDFSQFDDLGVNDYELLTVTYTFSDDPDNSTFFGSFAVVVEGANDAPVADDATLNANAGATVTGTVAATDVDGDELTFTSLASAIPGTFDIDAATGEFTLTLDQAASGLVSIDVEVSDGNGGFDTATLTFNVNQAPTFNGFGDYFFAEKNVTTGFDAGFAFEDPELGDLTFDARLVGGGSLPSGLSIDPLTGFISGNPIGDSTDVLFRFEVTATDEFGASTTAENWLTITDNVVQGTTGDDILTALTDPALDGATQNLIVGGAGNDLLNGFDEEDIYLYRPGDGFDQIVDDGFGDFDQVLFEDINPDDVVFRRFGTDSDDLIVELVGSEFQFTDGFLWINALTSNFSQRLDQISFQDGTVLDLDEIRALVVQDAAATAGNSTQGTLGQDTLQGAFDGAVLVGNGGTDSYLFDPGDGYISVDNRTGGNGVNNQVTIGFNLFDPATGDLIPELHRSAEGNNDDLILDFGNGDILRVVDVLEGNARIEIWNFADTTVDTAFFRAALMEQEGTAGNDIIIGFDGSNLADTVEGGAGDDILDGFDGSDTYLYSAGDGNDTISDNIDTNTLNVEGFDLIVDQDGFVVPASEVTFRRTSIDLNGDTRPDDDLVIEFDGAAGTGSITIYDQLDTRANGAVSIFNFVDAGGVNQPFTTFDIRKQIVAQAETSGDDRILGFNLSEDTLRGSAGNDFLDGRDGTDTYIYNAGDGVDTILDSGTNDEDLLQVNGFDLIFDADGLVDATSEVQFTKLPGSFDLKIALNNGSDQGEIIIEEFYAFQSARVIENLVFSGDNAPTTIRFSDIYFDTLQRQVTTGDDNVVSPAGSNFIDTYTGGPGDDIVALGGGDDIYNFNAGDQRLRIVETNAQGADTLFINDYTFAELEFDMMPYFVHDINAVADLRIRPIAPVDPADEIILVEGYIDAFTLSVETIVDSTGATMTRAEAVQRAIDEALADGDPYIYGTRQTDIFSETIGADVFVRGRAGNDTYSFSAGDGYDTYREDGAGGSDIVNLVGFSSADVGSTITLIQNNYRPDDIWIDFGNGDRLFLANTDQFETINFLGNSDSLNRTEFNTLVANNAVVVTDISDQDGDNFTIFTSTAADERFLGGSNGVNPATGVIENDQAFFTIGEIGHDIIEQGVGQTDVTINLGATGEVSFERGQLGNGSDIIINVFNTGATSRSQMETIRVVAFDKVSGAGVENLTLITGAGTTTMTADDIGQAVVDGMSTAGDDSVFGFDGGADGNSPPIGRGNETIEGGAGDDYLRGGGGVSDATGGTQEDLYRFTIGANGQGGDGRDILQDAGAGDMDRVEFISGSGDSASFANANIYFAQDDRQDVVIDFGFDEVRIVDLARNIDAARIDEFVFDANGAATTFTDLELLEFLVASQNTDGDDHVRGTDFSDTLEGGAGDDFLQGFVGDDTYIYTVGADGDGGGRDIIDDASAGNNDVVRIVSGGTTNGIGSGEFDNVTFRRDAVENETLVLDFGADELRLRNFLSLNNSTDYTVIFDAGGLDQTFTREQLIQEFVAQAGTDGDDFIEATRLTDTINGGLGDDTILGDAQTPDVFEFAPNQGDDILFHRGNEADNVTVRIFADFDEVDLMKTGDPRAGLDLENLLITFDAGGSVEIVDAFNRVSTSGEIANWVFDDVTFDRAEIHALTMQREIDRGVNQLLGESFDDVDRDIDTDGDGVADVTVGAIRGTARDEFLSGGGGGDTYIYTVGAGGYDTILDDNNAFNVRDELIIEGARFDQVIFERGAGPNQETDLILRFTNADGQIHIVDTFRTLAANRIEDWTFRGVDAVTGAPTEETRTLSQIIQRTHQDQLTSGDDVVLGVGNGDDDLLPNIGVDPATAGGNDSFSGLTGDDTYIFIDAVGVTQRTTIEDNGSNSDSDTLDVQGYDAADVTVRRVVPGGDDLLFTFAGTDDQILVLNSATATDTVDSLENFIFNGVDFSRAEIVAAADSTGQLPSPGAPLTGGDMAGTPPEPLSPALEPIMGDGEANLFETDGASDTISGFAGDDTIRSRGGDDMVKGGADDDVINGGAGEDTLIGGGGADSIVGADQGDRILGGGGGDTLSGGRGADLLNGGGGNDRLLGGAGADTIIGGAGNDTLTGGGGADRFVFNPRSGKDVVRDFNDGVDKLDFSGHSGVDRFRDLDIVDVANGALIRDGLGNSVRLLGVDADDLNPGDFIF